MATNKMEYQLNDRLYIIPQDPENRISLLNVDRHTKEDVRLSHRVFIDHDWQANTIANAYIEMIIQALGMDVKNTGNANAAWNFYDYMTAHVTVKRNEDAEKEGNINIAFEIGPKVEEIITDDTLPENRAYTLITPEAAFSFPTNPAKNAAYLKIDKVARMSLNEKYSIVIADDWIVTAVAVNFFANIIRELLYEVANSGKKAASINFNDNIECHAVLKGDDKVSIMLRPGMNAKLLIKSDETTEAEDDGE